MSHRIYRNLPNIASILGVFPLGFLLLPQGYVFLIPLILFNNFMDDLDGVLAARLNLKSDFGAILDNVCDAASHTLFVLLVSMHYGGYCALGGAVAVICILLRISLRLKSPPQPPRGSSTNELIRHMLFLLLLADQFEFNTAIPLTVLFALHGISMLVPFEIPHLIRNMTRTTGSIALVNLALITAWLVPVTVIPIAICFVGTYLYSILTQTFKFMVVPTSTGNP
ncbi:MAG: hypothetical protein HOH33_06720 [Verrucomicrobia bacterium]|jgi:phosphatidylglycerophosphate synthase|nr:hypothetical protein [Verrucomicrobiota bacterium]